MINTLSKVSSVLSNANQQQNIRFNGSLPITITVLEVMSLERYKLLLGSREFTTKSQKKLEKGAKYWGNFGENKDGIITISGLLKKPSFFQNSSLFLDMQIDTLLQEFAIVPSPIRSFKNWILENLALKETDKETFKALSIILLALNEKVIHLPFKSAGKPILVQFHSLFDNSLEFYLAYENLGPMRGTLVVDKGEKSLYLNVLFEKSFLYLRKELEKLDIISHMNIDKNIVPLYDMDKLMLDVKG